MNKLFPKIASAANPAKRPRSADDDETVDSAPMQLSDDGVSNDRMLGERAALINGLTAVSPIQGSAAGGQGGHDTVTPTAVSAKVTVVERSVSPTAPSGTGTMTDEDTRRQQNDADRGRDRPAVRGRRAMTSATVAAGPSCQDQLSTVMRQISEAATLQRTLVDQAAVLLQGANLPAAPTSGNDDPFLTSYAEFMIASVAQMDAEARGHWQDYLLKCALHWFDLILPEPKPENIPQLTKALREQFPPAKDTTQEAIERLKTCALGDNMTNFVSDFNADVAVVNRKKEDREDASSSMDITRTAPVSEAQLCTFFLDGLGRQPAHGIRLRDMVVARHDPYQAMTLTTVQDLAVVYYTRMGLDAPAPAAASVTGADRRQEVASDETPRKIRAIALEDDISSVNQDRRALLSGTPKVAASKGLHCRNCNRSNHDTADCRQTSARTGALVITERPQDGRTSRHDGRKDSHVIGRPTSSASIRFCENCKRTNHNTAQCRLPLAPSARDRERDRERDSFSNGNGSSSNPFCRICKRAGHATENCRYANGNEPPVCSNCHIRGHTVRTCHKLGRYASGDSRDERIVVNRP
ncbi:hypothetical protein HKX48_003265 [Thoreauomyces humboldtii]|nr:hypothetical protein HKX48_003265 [Thoreauomyces humboldtii]